MWAMFLDVPDSFSGLIVKFFTPNIDRAADRIRDSTDHSFVQKSDAKGESQYENHRSVMDMLFSPVFPGLFEYM